MKKLSKAFTLIELLAVIIVLAIIALIATPTVINVINTAKDKSDLESVHGMLDSARLYYSESMLDSNKKTNIENLNDIYNDVSLLNKPDNGKLYINEKGLIALSVIIRNKCYIKQFNGEIEISEDITNCTLGYIGIDTEAPTVSFNVLDGTFNSNGWANSNFNVNITISDNESGPSSYKYCIDTKDCEPTALVNNVTGFSEINTNSETNKVCVIGIDNYGNESNTICSDNYKLDSLIPTLTAISNSITIAAGSYNLVSNYFNTPAYGISGGSLLCSPTNTSSLSVGNQTISCTATSNSGLIRTTQKVITVKERIVTSTTNSCINNGSICSNNQIKNGIAVTVKVNSYTSYGFYVIKDTGSYVELIMNSNLTKRSSWGVNNTYGPTIALPELESLTNDWTNIPTFTYIADGLDLSNNLKYSPITRTARARLITAQEINSIGCGDLVCSWMITNMSETDFPGYWTSTPEEGIECVAVYVGYNGYFYHPTVSYSGSVGLRAVIRLPKSLIF